MVKEKSEISPHKESPNQRESPYEDLKKSKLKKKNPFDDMLDELEDYEKGCEENDLRSSGE